MQAMKNTPIAAPMKLMMYFEVLKAFGTVGYDTSSGSDARTGVCSGSFLVRFVESSCDDPQLAHVPSTFHSKDEQYLHFQSSPALNFFSKGSSVTTDLLVWLMSSGSHSLAAGDLVFPQLVHSLKRPRTSDLQ
jgi:hypothetical protein